MLGHEAEALCTPDTAQQCHGNRTQQSARAAPAGSHCQVPAGHASGTKQAQRRKMQGSCLSRPALKAAAAHARPEATAAGPITEEGSGSTAYFSRAAAVAARRKIKGVYQPGANKGTVGQQAAAAAGASLAAGADAVREPHIGSKAVQEALPPGSAPGAAVMTVQAGAQPLQVSMPAHQQGECDGSNLHAGSPQVAAGRAEAAPAGSQLLIPAAVVRCSSRAAAAAATAKNRRVLQPASSSDSSMLASSAPDSHTSAQGSKEDGQQDDSQPAASTGAAAAAAGRGGRRKRTRGQLDVLPPHDAVAARVVRAGPMHRLDLSLQQARAAMAYQVRAG